MVRKSKYPRVYRPDTWLTGAIQRADWRIGYKGTPAEHEYVMVYGYKTLYRVMLTRCKRFGERKQWDDKQWYTYYEYEGYKYWVVGGALNREKLSDGAK